MAKLELIELRKSFGPSQAVRGITCAVEEGQFVVLLGPSGCGKTTTLRLIAGLIPPDGGRILMDGRVIASERFMVPPERRNMSMVFQSYALWPHMTAFENVAYGLKIRGVSKDEMERRVIRALEMVHLAGALGRYPAELSGGQQQRVALARAIVVEPAVLLLDEPLSNLDASLREEMRFELKELQQNLGITSIYVTHDQSEAMVLADKLIVMNDGRIEQQDSPEEIYLRPATRFVAGFIGATNLVDGKLIEKDSARHLAGIETGFGLTLWAHLPEALGLSPGDPASIAIRPGEVELRASPIGEVCNLIRGRIIRKIFLGDVIEYRVEAKGFELRVRTPRGWEFHPGEEVWATFRPQDATVLI